MLVGDFGQLPPVMNLPLYSAVPRSAIADLGRSTYQLFAKAVNFGFATGWTGQRTGKISRTASSLQGWRGKYIADWELLMTPCRSQVDSAAFGDALHLHPAVQAVAEYNVAKLRNTGEPIATIKAVHTGPNASKASPKMLQDLSQSSALPVGPGLCSPLTYGQLLAL